MTAAERMARLRLIRTEGVGPVTFRRLVERFGSAAAAVDALPDLPNLGTPVSLEAARAEFEAAGAVGAEHVFLGEPAYPPLLAELADPPPMLLMRGDPGLAAGETVAIVGARNASAAGRALARRLAEDLGEAGFVVVSGMARGIDAAAHEGALATGTIACVAGGPDVGYPPENAGLQEGVGARGLIVAELPPGTEPQARHFPRRNRLIAGIARGVVVIEAAFGSGSLITARLAGEAGREVMAVPGHPADPRARGGNGLLKAGATLVEDAADVIAALRPFALPAPKPMVVRDRPEPDETPADARARIEQLLSPVPVPVEELVRQSGLAASAVTAQLTDLELEGRLVRHSGGRVAAA
jgi:DNA processing protein